MPRKSDISDREAALLAAARQEVAGRAAPPRSPPASPVGPVSTSPSAASPIPAAQPAKPLALAPVAPPAPVDASARMALLMEAEREANQLRKQRLHRRTLIGLSVLIVPMFLYVIGTLVSILGR